MARLIRANGSSRMLTPDEIDDYRKIQKLVGGYYQQICISTDKYMVMWEEAKLNGHPPRNEEATFLASNVIAENDEILGDVIVGTWEELGGNDDGEDS